MKTLVFATQNQNKANEIAAMLSGYTLKTLPDVGIDEDIPEREKTLEGNALAKARYVNQKLGISCFADDTGLEVEALDGAPGVYSARYAGAQKSAEANMDKLLSELSGKDNRKARFRTVIALILNGEEYLFEGIVEGEILTQKTGSKGFGYDPVFRPLGYEHSFAEMAMEAKNKISHRARAVEKLVDFLKKSQD